MTKWDDQTPLGKFISAASLFACFFVWHAAAIEIGDKDAVAIDKLVKMGARVHRNSSWSPVCILGVTPDDFGRVSDVYFYDTTITDEHISIVLMLESCEGVGFTNCKFRDRHLLCKLQEMPDVDTIFLVKSTVDDELLATWAPCLRNIKMLFLYDTALTDASIGAIAKLPKLRDVDVANTNVTFSGRERLRQAGIQVHH